MQLAGLAVAPLARTTGRPTFRPSTDGVFGFSEFDIKHAVDVSLSGPEC